MAGRAIMKTDDTSSTMDVETYPPHARSKVHRLAQRAAYDYGKIHEIVNTAPILHVAFQPTDPAADPFPTILPMIGAMGSYVSPSAALGAGPMDLYLHGSSTARMQQMADARGNDPAGIPVCVAATHVDGYVLALAPFHNSYNYRSAVLHGRLAPVADAAERDWALQHITDLVVPGRWDASRAPPTPAEQKQTGVMKVTVESASAKVRAAGVGKEDRKDEKDVRDRVWTGVVPAWTQFGEPVPAPPNVVEPVPEYLEGWRVQGNQRRETYAVEAAAKKA